MNSVDIRHEMNDSLLLYGVIGVVILENLWAAETSFEAEGMVRSGQRRVIVVLVLENEVVAYCLRGSVDVVIDDDLMLFD
jgi:hypothetical protein